MKRHKVINQPLSNALAGLGHGDYFLLCDAGFPIPKQIERIDLALTFNVPSMKQCVEAILDEVIVQKIVFAEEMSEWNPTGATFIRETFTKQDVLQVPHTKLEAMAQNAKFIVRSGDIGCYSNILMEAASGVDLFKKPLIIDI